MSKRRSEKKTQKRSKKRNAGSAGKTVSGGVGPFKTTKRNIRKVSKLDRWTKHAQTSLKAQWRIYIYMALCQFAHTLCHLVRWLAPSPHKVGVHKVGVHKVGGTRW